MNNKDVKNVQFCRKVFFLSLFSRNLLVKWSFSIQIKLWNFPRLFAVSKDLKKYFDNVKVYGISIELDFC